MNEHQLWNSTMHVLQKTLKQYFYISVSLSTSGKLRRETAYTHENNSGFFKKHPYIFFQAFFGESSWFFQNRNNANLCLNFPKCWYMFYLFSGKLMKTYVRSCKSRTWFVKHLRHENIKSNLNNILLTCFKRSSIHLFKIVPL